MVHKDADTRASGLRFQVPKMWAWGGGGISAAPESVSSTEELGFSSCVPGLTPGDIPSAVGRSAGRCPVPSMWAAPRGLASTPVSSLQDFLPPPPASATKPAKASPLLKVFPQPTCMKRWAKLISNRGPAK